MWFYQINEKFCMKCSWWKYMIAALSFTLFFMLLSSFFFFFLVGRENSLSLWNKNPFFTKSSVFKLKLKKQQKKDLFAHMYVSWFGAIIYGL